MTSTNHVTVGVGGLRLLMLVIAVFLFLVASFGVGDKLGFSLVDLGLAFGFGSFIFG